MNRNIFCGRRGGATIGRKFYPLRTSQILEREIERMANKLEARRIKRHRRRIRRW